MSDLPLFPSSFALPAHRSLGVVPAGATAQFSQATIEVPPGLSNFREIELLLTPAAGSEPGDVPIQVSAASTTSANVSDTATGNLTVLANGVSVTLSPPNGDPGDEFQLNVTNTGQITDTFALSLSGPGGLIATLGVDEVTLAPGASQMVSISTTNVDFAVTGWLDLIATATSTGQPAVRDSAKADLQIAPSRGLAANFDPPAKGVSILETASFILLLDNLGNVEDQFTATITGTTGPINATLSGLDGELAQVIPVFRLSGLSTGAILVNANLLNYGEGRVMVEIRSRTNAQIVSEVVARLVPRGCGMGIAHPWNNPAIPLDVNGDGLITPVGDVLPGINALNRRDLLDATGRLPVPLDRPATFCYDINDVDFLTPVADILSIINFLNRGGNPEGEVSSVGPETSFINPTSRFASAQRSTIVFPIQTATDCEVEQDWNSR